MASTRPDQEDQVRHERPEAEPESPLKVPPSGWRDTLKRTIKEVKQDRVSLTAAGVAFYWFLSVFPALFAAIGLLAIVEAGPAVADAITDGIRSVLPGGAATVLTDAVAASQTRAGTGGLAALIIGVVVALWSASSGMAAAQAGLDVAYDVPEERKFVKKRLVALVLIVATFVLGGVATALLVFGEPIGEFVRDDFPLGGAFVWVWTAIRWIVTILAIVTLFAFFYYVGPNRQPPSWKWISPGGLVATVIWLAASLGFSLYVSRFGGTYGRTYGALAGVVILVLWLYLTALALLLGGELNGELERERAMREGGSRDDRSHDDT